MKNILVSLVIVLACGTASAQSTAIEGNWGAQQQAGGMTFDISTTSVTVTNVCSVNGQTATAQVTSQSSYTDTTMTVLEAKQDQKSMNGLNCNAETQPATMGYTIQGNQLILSQEGSADTFVWIRK